MTGYEFVDVQMTKINALVLFSHHNALILWVWALFRLLKKKKKKNRTHALILALAQQQNHIQSLTSNYYCCFILLLQTKHVDC